MVQIQFGKTLRSSYFPLSAKFSACYVMGQCGEFRMKHSYILVYIFRYFFGSFCCFSYFFVFIIMYALKWAYLWWAWNISLTVRSRQGTFVFHGQIWKKIIFYCFWYDCFIWLEVNYITFKVRYEFKTSVLNIVCGLSSCVLWVCCHRGIVPSWLFRGSTTFSFCYFMGPKLFLVGILWDQNIFWSVLFQIDFNNC